MAVSAAHHPRQALRELARFYWPTGSARAVGPEGSHRIVVDRLRLLGDLVESGNQFSGVAADTENQLSDQLIQAFRVQVA
jgi:hypothetical protein